MQASDLCQRFISSGGGFYAYVPVVDFEVGFEKIAVVVDGFDNLISLVKLLNWYSHELFGVNGTMYYMQITNSESLIIAQKGWRYFSFKIYIEDIAIVALDMQYLNIAGS